MFFMPFQVLGVWLRGLVALALLTGSIALLTWWYNHRETRVVQTVEVPQQIPPGAERETGDAQRATVREERTRVVSWEFGLNRETAALLGGLALLGWALGGGWVAGSPRLFRRVGADEPAREAFQGTAQRIRCPDGTELHVESFGPADGIPVVLTHGWGLDGSEWYYAKKELGGRYRLIAWDLPGLGESSRPPDRDWDLGKLAGYLDTVVAQAGGKPVVLLGHSIGTMITLTYCQRYPEALGRRVRALVLAHGTYTNPVRTTARAGLYAALQKPVLEPLCHLMVWLAPVVRVLNWLSYLNGSAHRSTERDSFSGNETRGQLDFIARHYCKPAPDVLGRGMLAMFGFEATEALATVPVATLVVTGNQDQTCLPEASRFMAEAIPRARLVTLTPARHCGLFEQHGQFHAALTEFLDEGPAAALEPARPGTALYAPKG